MDDNIGAGRTMDKYFFQPTGKFIERIFAKIALRLHITREGVVVTADMFPSSDNASLLTGSSTSTTTDNPGTGRVIDKYIYQVLGRMLERCAGRIAMATYLSALDITVRIEEVWFDAEIKEPCCVCQVASVRQMSKEEKVRMAVSRVEDAPSGAFILSGIKEITKRLR